MAHDGTIHTSHDNIPDFAHAPTIRTTGVGDWHSEATWDQGRIPTASDIVLVSHLVSFAAEGEADVIGVTSTGTLAFLDGARLTVGTLQSNGGTIIAGHPDLPISCEIVIRDKPLDTKDDGAGTFDPFQFGTGIICIDGKLQMCGHEKTAWVRAPEELRAGQILTGAEGDKFIVPDTRDIRTAPSQCEIVDAGQPLQFDHLGARDHTGALRFLPHVANLTRSIVIRSENQQGTRGHMMVTGNCDLDMRNVAIVGMGRTQPTRIGVTIPHPTIPNIYMIGSNQIGRYPLHLHHLRGVEHESGYRFTVKGCVMDDCRKWGLAIHGTHYGLVEDCIVHNATGAGFVFESGSETGNMLRGNLAINISGIGSQTNSDRASSDQVDNGHSGDGFWSRSQRNFYVGNVAANCRWAGFNSFIRRSHVGKPMDLVYNGWGISSPLTVPVSQHSDEALPYDARQSVPFEFSDNESYACGRGFEWWYCWAAIVDSCRAWHISSFPMFFQYHGTALVTDFVSIGGEEGIVGQHGMHLQLRMADIDGAASPFRVEPNKRGIVFEDVRFDGVEQPSPPHKPIVVIDPAPDSVVSGIVTLRAPASVNKILFNVNGKRLALDTTSPYEAKWDTTKYPSGTAWVTVEQGEDLAFFSGRYFVSN